MSITKRIDGVTHIPESHRRIDPPAPRSVKIELTSRCNYRCSFCAVATRTPDTAKDMPWELFTRITREMRDVGVSEIGLFYLGESFMVPQTLEHAIEYLKRDLGMPYVFLTSNASRASAEHVEACMAAGLDSLKWSVNAATPEQLTTMNGIRGRFNWDLSLEHIKSAWEIRQSKGYKTRISASSIRYDGEQGKAMEAMLETHVKPFVDQHYWLPLYSMGDAATVRLRGLGYKPIVGNVGRDDAKVEPLPCWACFTEGHVLCDGRLSACCFDAQGRWIMGDLSTQRFMDAWNSPAFQSLRAAHLRGDVTGTACEACVASS